MKKQESKLDTQKMMEVYKELAIPGEPHKLLASMAGSWDAKVKNWMDPDKPAAESIAVCKRHLVLGGRYLEEEFTGEMMGLRFSGIGFTGYDNFNKKYVMTWIDTMSTGIYLFEGRASADGKTLIFEARFDDPVKGQVKWHSETRIVDENTEIFEISVTGRQGREEKTEITYTRKPIGAVLECASLGTC